MRRSRLLGLVIATTTAAGVAALPAASGAIMPAAGPVITWKTTSVGENSAGKGEPSLAISPDGKHSVVSVPDGDGVTYWFTGNDGKTWGTTHSSSQGGGGDSELMYLRDGSLISADLEVYDSNVKISTDNGATWDAGRAAGIEQDRQWFAQSRDGEVQYLVYHDFVAEAELYAQSSDGGKTWDPVQHVVNSADQGTAVPGQASTPAQGDSASFLDQGGNTFSGPMLIAPHSDDMYVLYSISDLGSNLASKTPPYGPTRGIVVAHSADKGATWTNKYAVTSVSPPTDPAGSSTPVNGAIFPWGTVDDAGNVYVLYNSTKEGGHFHQYYVWSGDQGQTWSPPIKVDDNPTDQGAAIYATGEAGAPGVLDVAWYSAPKASGPDDNTADWYAEMAQVRNATTASPTILRTRISPRSIHHGNICLNGLLCLLGGDRSLLDFFELAIGPDGMAQVTYPENADEHQVNWGRQISGPSAFSTSALPVVKPPVTKPPAGAPKPKPGTPGGGPLAATGATAALPETALALMALAGLGFAVRRRRLV